MPAISNVNPNAVQQGATAVPVTITGASTNFSAASVVTFSNAGVTAGAPTAFTLTSLTVPVTVTAAAALGAGDITVTTGAEVVTLPGGFIVTGAAKVVSLTARPWKATQLCFEVGGILDQMGAQLGQTVTPFDFPTFYGGLGAVAAGDGSLLQFDSNGILTAAPVTASNLANLRAEPRKAALDKAVSARQNLFYSKYGSIPSIVTAATNSYGSAITAKPALLQDLANLSQQQATLLKAAYTADGRTGVVRTTNSMLSSLTTTKDSSSSSGSSTAVTTPNLTTQTTGQTNAEMIGDTFKGATLDNLPADDPGGAFDGAWISDSSQNTEKTFSEETSGQTAVQTGTSVDRQTGGQSATGVAYAVESESIVNTDYSYRVPYIECQAQNDRAQISLIDQQFAQLLAGLNLPNLTTVLNNEKESVDLSVYQLQVGFLNTILFSPIPGTVTGVYKNPGDPVRPGEPVVRVEDNSTLLLLASVIYRGPIRIGWNVTVTTALYDASGPATSLPGSVIAARTRGEDDKWDLVVQCKNPLDGSGNPIFPIGYHFDYDNTTIAIA